MNIGIFGGTFSPPHIGHMIVAESVRESLALGSVVFVPTATPPHKQQRDIIDASHRLAMTAMAVRDNPHFAVSDIEVRRGGVSYTVDTLAELSALHRGDDLHLLIGMDNLLEFASWREPARILELARLVVLARPGFPRAEVPAAWSGRCLFCDVPEIEVASTDIRARVRAGRSLRYLVSDDVEAYIREHRLYLPEGRAAGEQPPRQEG